MLSWTAETRVALRCTNSWHSCSLLDSKARCMKQLLLLRVINVQLRTLTVPDKLSGKIKLQHSRWPFNVCIDISIKPWTSNRISVPPTTPLKSSVYLKPAVKSDLWTLQLLQGCKASIHPPASLRRLLLMCVWDELCSCYHSFGTCEVRSSQLASHTEQM